MRTSSTTTGTPARAFIAGLALLSVAGLGACSSGGPDQAATPSYSQAENAAAARALQGFVQPPAAPDVRDQVRAVRLQEQHLAAALALQGLVPPPTAFREQLRADNNAAVGLALQGIVQPPAAFLEQRTANRNAAAALAYQGIVHPPTALLERLRVDSERDSNAAAALALQGIVHPPTAP